MISILALIQYKVMKKLIMIRSKYVLELEETDEKKKLKAIERFFSIERYLFVKKNV